MLNFTRLRNWIDSAALTRRAFLRLSGTAVGGWLATHVLGLAPAHARPAARTITARGVVYHDRSGSGRRTEGDLGLPGVRVSNGIDIVTTDDQGRYELPVNEEDAVIFIIKPRNWMTPLDANNLPLFHYIHKPHGSPELRFRGIEPTGPLPESVDFPLVPRQEPDRFRVIAFADTQPRNEQELEYVTRTVVEELIGEEDATFGVNLGDIVFNNLNLLEPLNEAVGRIGVPWYNVVGNHDINFDVSDPDLAKETYRRIYGPPYYAFDYGNVHFINLDNIRYSGNPETREYWGEFGQRQLEFVRNDLEHVPPEKLVVLMMHIPLINCRDTAELLALLSDRPHTFSISGHRHRQWHVFMGEDHGWRGGEPHHHLVHGTVSGSWWRGVPDEYGIPHAMMRDGVPVGYSHITFDGNKYSIRYKAARRPADFQMHLYVPGRIARSELPSTALLANVFLGSPRSLVEMRIGEEGEWQTMEYAPQRDPYYIRLIELQEQAIAAECPLPGRPLPALLGSAHIWSAPLPEDLPVGSYLIQVRTTDMWGQTDLANRVIRVIEDPPAES